MPTNASRSSLEQVGPVFNAEQMLVVRQNTREVIREIADMVRPGMVEEDAVEGAKKLLASRKMLRGWHPVYVRFGANTTKTFGEASEPGVMLKAQRIFLIDIGPVFEQWEGDGGDTFVVGHAPHYAKCAEDARQIFALTRRKWLDEGATGRSLYDYRGHGSIEAGMEAQYGPIGTSPVGFSTCCVLRWTAGGYRIQPIAVGMGARDPHPPSRVAVRRIFRRYASARLTRSVSLASESLPASNVVSRRSANRVSRPRKQRGSHNADAPV